jgi:hypothetical protein
MKTEKDMIQNKCKLGIVTHTNSEQFLWIKKEDCLILIQKAKEEERKRILEIIDNQNKLCIHLIRLKKEIENS